MNGDGGTVTVHLKMDTKGFESTARKADDTGKSLGDSLDKNTSAATQRVSDRFDAFGVVAKRALIGTGLAAGVAGAASVKMAGDFEQSLAVLGSVSGATGKQMELLSAKARELGKDASLPGVSAVDAAGAMSELAKAGVKVNDVLGASKGVLSLAKAGQLEVSEAATISARALNSFGLAGNKAGMVADILAAGANASSADVGELAYAMSQAGSSANRMGVSLGDTVTALGIFSNAGINGSDAGTSLKTMLQRLAAPTDEAAGAMKKLGLDFFNAKGEFIGLQATAGQLQDKLKGLTQEQREQAIAAIFGADASRVAGVLAKEGSKGFAEMSKQVNKSGAAADLARAQNSGFNGALDNLKSTLETIGTDLGTKLLPPLTAFIKALADNAEPAVKFLIDNGKVLSTVLLTLAGAFAAVRVAGFVSDLGKAQKTLGLFVGTKNANGIRALGTAFKFMGGAAVTAIRAVGAAMLANPILLVISLIVGALVFLQVKFNIFGKLFQALKPVFEAVGNFMISVWEKIKTAFSTAVDAIVGFWNSKLKPSFMFMLNIVKTILSVYIKVWAFIALVIIGTLSIIAAVVWKVLQGIWNVISTVFNAYLNVVRTVLNAVLGVFKAVWNAIYNFLAPIVTRIVNFIKQRWENLKANVSRVLNAIWGVISGVWNKVWGFISPIVERIKDRIINGFKNIYNGIKNVLGEVIGFVGGIGGKILGKIGNFGKLLYNKGKDLIQGLLDGAGSLLSKIGKFFLDKVPGWIQDPFKKALGISSPSRVFKTFGKYIGEGLIQGLKGKRAKISKAAIDMVGDAIRSVKKKLGEMKNVRSDFIKQTAQNIAGSTGVVSAVGGGAKNTQSITSSLLKQLETVREFQTNLANLQKKGLNKNIIADIAQAGLEQGGATAKALSNATDQNIQEINTLQSSINKASKGVATIAGNALYSAGIQSMQGLLRGMQSQRSQVIKLITRLGDDMKKALKRKLGIRSPSTVFAGFGKNIVQGLAKGITGSNSIAKLAINNLSDDLKGLNRNYGGGDPALAGGGASGGSGGTTINQTNNINTEVDMDAVNRDLAWRTRK